jgi:hypothetical protein
VPLTLTELEVSNSEAAPNKSRCLYGLSYEFYPARLAIIGPHPLAALSSMLSSGLLSVSLRRSVVHLLPKVPAVPTVVQLRPITLLSIEYKILTKMLVARLLHVLPSVFCGTQLCSIQGCSTFEGWR